jgi:hypothetical protein
VQLAAWYREYLREGGTLHERSAGRYTAEQKRAAVVFLSISFFHVWHCCLSALAMKVFMFGKAYHIGYLAG